MHQCGQTGVRNRRYEFRSDLAVSPTKSQTLSRLRLIAGPRRCESMLTADYLTEQSNRHRR